MAQWTIPWLDVFSLGLAFILGGLLGIEREMRGHWAGFRTHIIVCLGSALFVIAGRAAVGDDPAQLSRIIQGVATGVGFIGAGTILKLTTQREVKGLTTAGSIWLVAGIGTVAAMRLYLLAILATVTTMVVMGTLRKLEAHIEPDAEDSIKGND